MGRITAPFGIKGWLKLRPLTAAPENLVAHTQWWIGNEANWRECRIEQAKVQSGSVVAKLAGCDDRDAAMVYRGLEVAVARAVLPQPGENEFYWADLIGLTVVNVDGIEFGAVCEVLETGANDVLVVQGERERLIPFTEQVVKQVDMAMRVIRVDWGVDY
ncbi:MAG TPA: ribosome maturation factor RimM [Burkholderiales bacterium]|jgi:16S rRNA processing protein RimM